MDDPIVERRFIAAHPMIIHTYYDAPTTTNGWAVVRTLPGSTVTCRTGVLPHITAERAFLATLLRELFVLPLEAPVALITLTPYPVQQLQACHPWVWRVHDWQEDGQPVANADLWAKLLPLIDQRPMTWRQLPAATRPSLEARLAHLLVRVVAQHGRARMVGTPVHVAKEVR